jgi:hypothetical protein
MIQGTPSDVLRSVQATSATPLSRRAVMGAPVEQHRFGLREAALGPQQRPEVHCRNDSVTLGHGSNVLPTR